MMINLYQNQGQTAKTPKPQSSPTNTEQKTSTNDDKSTEQPAQTDSN